jgi:hypothetical protein
MSHRDGGNYPGRGGGNPGARSGGPSRPANAGNGVLCATTCSKHTDSETVSKHPPQKFEQQFDSLNLKGKVAVDGSPLQMDPPVAIPSSKPMPKPSKM